MSWSNAPTASQLRILPAIGINHCRQQNANTKILESLIEITIKLLKENWKRFK